MRSIRLKTACLLLATPVLYTTLTSNKAGSPGRSVSGCGAGGNAATSCHATSTDEPLLVVTGLPANGWVPGTTYTLTASLAKNAKTAAGFDLYITDGAISNAPTGTSIASSSHELYSTTPQTASNGVASWTFTWTAPGTGNGMVIYFAGVGANNDGTQNGDQWSQWGRYYPAAGTASMPVPIVIAGAPTAIRTTAATLHATVNPNGPRATVWAQYGTSASYTDYAAADPGTVTTGMANPVMASLDGLRPNTTYHYRFVAKSANGRTETPDQTFTTGGNGTTDVANLAGEPLRVFPNPATTDLRVQVTESHGVAQIRVIDLAGRVLPVPARYEGTGTYLLDISKLPAGGYWLLFREGDHAASSAFQRR